MKAIAPTSNNPLIHVSRLGRTAVFQSARPVGSKDRMASARSRKAPVAQPANPRCFGSYAVLGSAAAVDTGREARGHMPFPGQRSGEAARDSGRGTWDAGRIRIHNAASRAVAAL